jgi:hypothetical protein
MNALQTAKWYGTAAVMAAAVGDGRVATLYARQAAHVAIAYELNPEEGESPALDLTDGWEPAESASEEHKRAHRRGYVDARVCDMLGCPMARA